MAEDVKPESKPDAAAPPLPPLAGKARDLEALRNAVVDAANVSGTLWFSYLFVLIYLAVAAGSVSHRNLLFESPVKLPFLNVELPLLGFFVLGPAIFLIVHAYVLLHFVLLAGKVGAFHFELKEQIADEATRTRLRRQLPSNIFVQFLAGPVEVRTGLMGTMLRLVAQISLIAGPLLLLVLFQVQFLPYHDEAVSWWQRCAVVIDLVLLWLLWPSVERGETDAIHWRDFRTPAVFAVLLASFAPVLFVFTVATFPGEWLDSNPVRARFIMWGLSGNNNDLVSLHDLLFAGDVDMIARKPTSLWSNRLVLPGIDVPPGSLSLRGRRLEGAVLSDANLREMDFTAAYLQRSFFTGADLRGAKFGCAESRRSTSDVVLLFQDIFIGASGSRCPQMQRAYFANAKMQDTMLNGVDLRSARFSSAFLKATLDAATLDGASLDGAALPLISLDGTKLRGASLVGANLTGVRLSGASMQGATLDRAELQGATLDDAHLQGASLDGAQLQVATLHKTLLHAASLSGTQLQGASLRAAKLHGANIHQAFVWRTDVRETDAQGARIVGIETRARLRGPECPNDEDSCRWTAASFARLKELLEKKVPSPLRSIFTTPRLSLLDIMGSAQRADPLTALLASQAPRAPEDAPRIWDALQRTSAATEIHERTLAMQLREAGCEAGGAPYVARGILRNLAPRFQAGSPQLIAVASAFLDELKCPGARGLSAEHRAKLLEMGGIPPQFVPGSLRER